MSDLSDKLAAFTIVSNNYLHYARSLMESVRTHEPDCHRYVMVLDTPVAQEAVDDTDLYSVIRVEDLHLPEPRKFLFRYNVLEANTAVKPWVMERLSREMGYKGVIYLDPDIYLYRSLLDVRKRLEAGATLVLTPHLMGPIDDGKRPDEKDILRAGAYNLGFAAVGEWSSAGPLLEWWQQRLERQCVVDPANGLFVDQKWMDLAPGLFPDVSILRHKGYNVAYWNLHERPVQKDSRGWMAGGDPLHFFHFSGLNVNDPDDFSKHQSRFRLKDIGDAKELVLEYCSRLKANGSDFFQSKVYGFSQHSLGYRIPDIVRRLYRSDRDVQKAWGEDPFSRDLTPLLNEFPEYDRFPPRMTRLMRCIWRERSDLREAFPNPEGRDRVRYVAWFSNVAKGQLNLPEQWVVPARAELDSCERREGTKSIPSVVDEVVNLFGLHGEAFVRRAYQLVLGRPADSDGLRNFSRHLASGARPRRWVLWALVLSPEGRKQKKTFREIAAFCLPLGLTRPFARRRPTPARHASPAVSAPPAVPEPAPARKTRNVGRTNPGGSASPVRIVGYLDMPTGVGESARRCIAAAEAAGLDAEAWKVDLDRTLECLTQPAGAGGIGCEALPITIAHINADQLCVMGRDLDRIDKGDSYRIGYWHWELPSFPRKFFPAFEFVDEIWVPSDHMLSTLTRVSPVPVVKIPHSVEVPRPGGPARGRYGIPEDAFAFLCMYDLQSYQERKNPMGAVSAYLKAFPQPSGSQCLVIKASNSEFDRKAFDQLAESVRGRRDIIILDRFLEREEVYELENSIDCFVSLHRAEGFGLCPAECMYLGKAVIATGWSGNMEYMTEENSYPVAFSMKTLSREIGPYEAGQEWAEPDLNQAAELMRRVSTEISERKRKTERARETLREHFSPRSIGTRYRHRIEAIRETRQVEAANSDV